MGTAIDGANRTRPRTVRSGRYWIVGLPNDAAAQIVVLRHVGIEIAVDGLQHLIAAGGDVGYVSAGAPIVLELEFAIELVRREPNVIADVDSGRIAGGRHLVEPVIAVVHDILRIGARCDAFQIEKDIYAGDDAGFTCEPRRAAAVFIAELGSRHPTRELRMLDDHERQAGGQNVLCFRQRKVGRPSGLIVLLQFSAAADVADAEPVALRAIAPGVIETQRSITPVEAADTRRRVLYDACKRHDAPPRRRKTLIRLF